MSVQTTYDDMRYKLKDDLNDCLKQAIELLKEDTYGYDQLSADYSIRIYNKVKMTRDSI